MHTIIDIPTLMIHGKNDPVIVPDHAKELHNLVPNSEMLWMDDCGHVPLLETPAAFAHAVHAWLLKLKS